MNRKELYYFAIFVIIKILIKKDWQINAHFAQRMSHGNKKTRIREIRLNFSLLVTLATDILKAYISQSKRETRAYLLNFLN